MEVAHIASYDSPNVWCWLKTLYLTKATIFWQAEKIASRMICEDRMRGSIDQVENWTSNYFGSYCSFSEAVIYILISCSWCLNLFLVSGCSSYISQILTSNFQTFNNLCQVEAVIHFEDDTEELQQWDQQVIFITKWYLLMHCIYF